MKKHKNGKKKPLKGILAAVAGVLLIGIPAISAISENQNKPERITYAQYQEYLKDGDIDIVKYQSGQEYMKIYLGNEDTADMTEEEKEQYNYPSSAIYRVQFPDNEDFRKEMLEQGVILVNTEDDNFAMNFIDKYAGLIIYVILIGVLVVAMKKNNPASATGFAQVVAPEDIDITFDDVIGHEEIKKDLKLLAKQMQDPEKVKDLSHGVLFEGVGGTGKTLLAKAVAKEAGTSFISVDSSNLVEMYVGLGARRVRDAFKQARKNAPCILFFDELDAVGAKRGSQRSHRENDQTINALLTEMDGFRTTQGVFIIAATNRYEDLDDALVRSGRFDRKVKVEPPKKWETRQELFDHYLKDQQTADDINTEILAKQVVGFTGADIAAVVRSAKLIAYGNDSEVITQDNIEEAIDQIVFKGNRSNAKQHEEDVKVVAYHEAGHAIATMFTGNEVSRISIRGMTSGVGGAVFAADNDKIFESKQELRDSIIIAYAGRASEQVFFGESNITQGASNDISKATALLYAYVAKYGYDNSFGLVDYDMLVRNGVISEKAVQSRISSISNELFEESCKLIRTHRNKTELLAQELIKVKTMDGNEVTALLSDKENKSYESC